MDIQKIIVIVVLVLCGIIWLGPMCIAISMEEQERKKRGEPPKNKALYDERQTIIRLRSGVHALLTLVGYLILWALLDFFGPWAWTDEVAPLVFGGVMLAAVVWTVECTLRDAAVGWNQNDGAPGQAAILSSWLICCAMWGNMLWEKGGFVISAVLCLTALGLAVMELVIYVKHRRKKRLEQEDE